MANAEKKYGYGDFGNLSGHYAKARLKYPEEIMDFLFSLTNSRDEILDLGSGTGISTRQIAQRNQKVIGCEKDSQMVKEAIKENDGINYVIAPAEKLPFANGTFPAVTAFSAFHWFCNDGAVSEIKRILKPNGIFFVANKKDVGDFKEVKISHDFIINDIDIPKNEKDFVKMRENAIRKGKVVRKMDIDGKKQEKEAEFEA